MARNPKKLNASKPLHATPTLADIARFIGKLTEVSPPDDVAHLVEGNCWLLAGHEDDKGYRAVQVRRSCCVGAPIRQGGVRRRAHVRDAT
jgi:hypothetical protein